VTEDDPTPHENASDARGITPDRPTILYPKPELAKAIALTPDGPLLRLRWRNHEYSITHCLGPERLGAEWWRWQIATSSPSFPPERDYFAAQTDEGRWLFVARQPRTGRWFVHGEWA
jgi:protein ImuB